MDWAADRNLNNAARDAGFVVVVRPDPNTGQVVGSAYSQEHFTQDFTCVGPDVEHVVREITEKLMQRRPVPPSTPPTPPTALRDGVAFRPRLVDHDGGQDGERRDGRVSLPFPPLWRPLRRAG